MADLSTLRIQRGTMLQFVLQFARRDLASQPIQSVTKSCPAVVGATAHGVPDGWPVAIVSALGMTQINAENWPPKSLDFHVATRISADSFSMQEVNSSNYGTHTANSGFVVYYSPLDLSGCTARGSVKDKFGGTELVSLTSGSGGGISIDVANSALTVTLTAVQTAAIASRKAAIGIELIDSSGEVIRSVNQGGIPVDKEVST